MDRSTDPTALTAPVWRRLRRDPRALASGAVLALLVLALIGGPFLYGVDPARLDLSRIGEGPTAAHWLGTDESGRDVLSRLLHGGRVSLAVGGLAVLLALLFGIALGGVAGFRRGPLDGALMRATDAMLSIPTIFLVITALAFFGSTVPALVLAIGGTAWMGLARLVRGELLSIREQAYIEAARAL
ncbi:MAG: ABC transporter permease, partial [Gemmatimonadaceae bacterium]